MNIASAWDGITHKHKFTKSDKFGQMRLFHFLQAKNTTFTSPTWRNLLLGVPRVNAGSKQSTRSKSHTSMVGIIVPTAARLPVTANNENQLLKLWGVFGLSPVFSKKKKQNKKQKQQQKKKKKKNCHAFLHDHGCCRVQNSSRHPCLCSVASHWRVKEGQSAPFDSKKIAKNWEKEGENQEKSEKNREKEEKSGRIFHFAPPDR